jgi:hypothetical protein
MATIRCSWQEMATFAMGTAHYRIIILDNPRNRGRRSPGRVFSTQSVSSKIAFLGPPWRVREFPMFHETEGLTSGKQTVSDMAQPWPSRKFVDLPMFIAWWIFPSFFVC